MKILVVSDNHANETSLEDLLYIYEDEVDLWLHCGDSEFLANHSIWQTFKTVRGNMDREEDFPLERIEKVGDETLLIVHGHKHRVRYSFEQLNDSAVANGADLVFYGHTHIADVTKYDGKYFINPGSITQPRGFFRLGSYAIYETNGTDKKISFYDWNHNEISELTKELT